MIFPAQEPPPRTNRKEMTLPLDRIRRLAIIRLSALGDVVNTLPALTALRRALPSAHIAWVCESASAPLLEGHPLLDEVIAVPRKRWGADMKRLVGLLTVPPQVWRFARTLQRARFDTAIDFQGNFRSGLVAFHTKAPVRIGFGRAHASGGRRSGGAVSKEWSHLFTTHHVPLPHQPLHRVELGLRLVAALGIPTADAAPVVPATDSDRERVAAFLEDWMGSERVEECKSGGVKDEAEHGQGLRASSQLLPSPTPSLPHSPTLTLFDSSTPPLSPPFAVVHAGTSAFGRYKQWTLSNWVRVSVQLFRQFNLRTVFSHGPDRAETRAAEALAAEANTGGRRSSGAVAAPTLSLHELAELFRRCRLFLSVDTGPMHLASAVGAPVVALFGPKSPALYGPYFGPRAIVEKDLDCRPCLKRSCSDPRCMYTITPEEVLAAAEQLLRETQ
jgi:heptosyltransferase I